MAGRIAWGRRLVVAVACAVAVPAVAAPSAEAERFGFAVGMDVVNDGNVCALSCQSGRAGAGAGELTLPSGTVAVGDELWVADTLNLRIAVLDRTTGAFEMAFGTNVGGPGVDTCTTTCRTGSQIACLDPVFPAPGQTCATIGRGAAIGAPGGIALANGLVYVPEGLSRRVSVWDAATKTFVRAFGKDTGGLDADTCVGARSCLGGSVGEEAGALASPSAVAVAGDDVFVTDTVNHRVSVFDAGTGAFRRAFGKDVGGPGLDVCTAVCRKGAAGSADGVIEGATGVAVLGGRLFVSEPPNNRISVLDAQSGAFLRAYGTDVGGPGVNTCTSGCGQGGAGDGPGQLATIGLIAASGGALIVGEGLNRRVSLLDPATGAFVRAYGKDVGGPGVDVCTISCRAGAFTAAAAGELSPLGVTIAGGRLYVTEVDIGTENHRVSVLDAATGSFRFMAGRSVQRGELGEAERCRLVCEVGRRGTGAGHLFAPWAAAAGGGRVFVPEFNSHRVSAFDAATGAFVLAFGKDVGGPGVDVCTTVCGPDAFASGTLADAGRIFAPFGVATDGAEVFVTDAATSRISVFSAATGVFLRAFGNDVGGPGVDICTAVCEAGTPGSGAGELTTGFSLAVAGGELFVNDSGNRRIAVFDAATGAFRRAFGADVGGAGVDVCTSANPGACQAGTAGTGAGQLQFAFGLAVAGGQVFVSEQLSRRVSQFDAATGAFVRAFGKNVGGRGVDVCTTDCRAAQFVSGASGFLDAPAGLSAAGGELFVADQNGRIAVFSTADGTWLRAIGRDLSGAETCTSTCQGADDGPGAGQLSLSQGVAVTPSGIFVADLANNRVSVFARAADPTVPETRITAGPEGPTADAAPAFAFAATEAGAAFECRVDARRFRACTSPETVPALGDGPHTFEVRAVDVDWHADLSPATRSFTVDTAPPQTAVDDGPGGPAGTGTPSFAFSADQAGATFACRVDGAPFAPCTSPHTTPAADPGAHVFEVRATDAAGNADPTPASRAFTVEVRRTPPPPPPAVIAPPPPPPPPAQAPPPPPAPTPDPARSGYPDDLYPGPVATRTRAGRDSRLTLQYPRTCVRAGQKFTVRLTGERLPRPGGSPVVRVTRVDVLLAGRRLRVDRLAPYVQQLRVPAATPPATTVRLQALAFVKLVRGRATRTVSVDLRVCERP